MRRGCVANFSSGRLLKWEFLFSLPSWEHQLLQREPVKTEGGAPDETLQLTPSATPHCHKAHPPETQMESSCPKRSGAPLPAKEIPD